MVDSTTEEVDEKSETPKTRSTKQKDWELTLPSRALQARIQRALGRRHRYSGPANGVFNEKTLIAIQETLSSGGFRVKKDGNLETRAQCLHIQEYARDHGDFAGPMDRKLTEEAWAAFALAVERTK